MSRAPSPWEGAMVARLRSRLRAVSQSAGMRRVAVALNDNPDGIYQELALQVVDSCRVWAEKKGSEVEPDIGFLIKGMNFRIGKLRRSAARHGKPTELLHEEHPEQSMVVPRASDNTRPDAPIVAEDDARGLGAVCDLLREHRPEGYALLAAAARGELPTPLSAPVRNRLSRERAQARRFLATLGIGSVEHTSDVAPQRLPAPPPATP